LAPARLGRLGARECFANSCQLGVVQSVLDERKEHALLVTDVALEQVAETVKVVERGPRFA